MPSESDNEIDYVVVQPQGAIEPEDDVEPGGVVDPEDVAVAKGTEPEADRDPVEEALRALTIEVAKYHDRASHRESVIDKLHADLEQVRKGERRGLLRPLLAGAARLRDDLLRQSSTLPDDFDAQRARKLLTTYADMVELLLLDHGVDVQEPAVGTAFDPRRQRVLATRGTSDHHMVNTVAEVVRGGYIDADSGIVLGRAEVIVHTLADEEPPSRDESTPSTTEHPHNSTAAPTKEVPRV